MSMIRYDVMFIVFTQGIKKGNIFPRVAKNNRFVHPKAARGVALKGKPLLR